MNGPTLRIRDLKVYYYVDAGEVRAVDGVSFDLEQGLRLGLVGESGCGKSTMAMGIMRLIKSPGKIVGGEINLDGTDLTKLTEEEMRQARLSQVSLIPQGAMNSLNPVVRVRDQIVDGIVDHGLNLSRSELDARVEEVLRSVDLRPDVANMFPHELSGGMKQRVCVAIAISLRPKLVIADEPTSALDVVVQRQVMETISRLQREMGISMILIGHDMGLMAQSVDRLAVMYAGRLMELADIEDIFESPRHPYTQLLINTLPTLGTKGVFHGIPGITPALIAPPPGCLFHPRCPVATEKCSAEVPPLVEFEPGRWAACHYEVVL